MKNTLFKNKYNVNNIIKHPAPQKPNTDGRTLENEINSINPHQKRNKKTQN